MKLEGRLNLEFGGQQAKRACGLRIQLCGFNPPSWNDVWKQQGWAHDRLTHELHLDSKCSPSEICLNCIWGDTSHKCLNDSNDVVVFYCFFLLPKYERVAAFMLQTLLAYMFQSFSQFVEPLKVEQVADSLAISAFCCAFHVWLCFWSFFGLKTLSEKIDMHFSLLILITKHNW